MLSKLTTGAKVFSALLFATAMLVLVGIIAFAGARRLTAGINDLADQKMPSVHALASIDEGQMGISDSVHLALLGRASAEAHRAAQGTVREKLAQIDDAARAYQAMPHHEEVLRLLAAWQAPFGEWRRSVEEVMRLTAERDALLLAGRAGGDPAIGDLEGRAWAAYQASREKYLLAEPAIAALVDRTVADADAASHQAHDASAATLTTLTVTILLSALALLAMAWLFSRRIGGTVRTLVAEAGRLSQAVVAGQLEVRGQTGHLDHEFRPVVEGMNATMEAFVAPLRLTADYVTRISRGELPPRITDRYQGDFNQVKESLNRCLDTLAALEADTVTLSRAAVEGRFEVRADGARHEGAFRRIVEGVNGTISTLVGHLDAMPAPAMVIDRDFRVRYMNAAGLTVLGRRDVLGQRCSDLFQTEDCNTDRCACARAMRDDRVASGETTARPNGQVLEIAYSGVPVRDGGRVIGAFEVISDQTAVTRAMRQSARVSEYQARETARVVASLEKLSRGDLSLDLAVGAADADTEQVRATYHAIAEALRRSADAVGLLSRDVGALVEAAVQGRLSIRAEAGKHQGDFRRIVEGVNQTLDAVIAPVTEASTVLERLAQRDLRARMAGTYQGDHASLKEAVDGTATALHDALAQVAEAVEQVSAASTQIAASSQAVAAGASEQASSLEETSASIESVAAITRQAADNAQQANTLSQAARVAATEGATSVEQMQGVMGRIRASAEGTSQIIKDVSDIAFQTNLLALNAAVEAARAGEAGRGFAVVAEEVRSLALRAKEAATKTEELIRQSVREAGEGEATSRQVARKLGEIVAGIGKVSDIVSEIAAAAREQASGIDQVNQAVTEMDKVTQQNASSAEESSSAASELSGQAEELATMVGAFRLLHRAAGAQAPMAPPPSRGATPALARPAPAGGATGARTGTGGASRGTRRARNGADAAFPMDDESVLRDF
jgi:methyl-accepting chemotaxis protein